MKTDNFYAIEVVDKLSRTFMTMFLGIILGSVLFLACYYLVRPGINWILGGMIAYVLIFSAYFAWTGSKRKISRVEIFKDRLSISFEQKGTKYQRTEIYYSDIKEYKISALLNSTVYWPKFIPLFIKNLIYKNVKSLRVGYKTTVVTNEGETFEFETSRADGVLIYSPAYIYRMIDVKRYRPDFPLILENFDDENDSENFNLQFKYYTDKCRNLSPFKNDSQIKGLLIYTIWLTLGALFVALYITVKIYNQWEVIDRTAIEIIWVIIAILLSIVVIMYAVTFVSSYTGAIINSIARNKIKQILE